MVTVTFLPGGGFNDVWLNHVALSIPKGESNGEDKASLNIGGVLPTRQSAVGKVAVKVKSLLCKGLTPCASLRLAQRRKSDRLVSRSDEWAP